MDDGEDDVSVWVVKIGVVAVIVVFIVEDVGMEENASVVFISELSIKFIDDNEDDVTVLLVSLLLLYKWRRLDGANEDCDRQVGVTAFLLIKARDTDGDDDTDEEGEEIVDGVTIEDDSFGVVYGVTAGDVVVIVDVGDDDDNVNDPNEDCALICLELSFTKLSRVSVENCVSLVLIGVSMFAELCKSFCLWLRAGNGSTLTAPAKREPRRGGRGRLS